MALLTPAERDKLKQTGNDQLSKSQKKEKKKNVEKLRKIEEKRLFEEERKKRKRS